MKPILIIISITLILTLVVLGIYFTSGIKVTRDAQQIGYVSAIENNGIIFRANFVYIKSELESSQEEMWCVKDEKVLEQLNEARDNRQRIKIIYYDQVFYHPSDCHNSSKHNGMIEKIELLNK